MFNPNPKIQLVPIPGHLSCIVIDDFLLDPQAMVEQAIKLKDSFAKNQRTVYPGSEKHMSEAFSAALSEFFMQHIRGKLGARRTLKMNSRLSMVTMPPHELSPYQRVCHRDYFTYNPVECLIASVLYLFRDTTMGGTSFYVPKIPEHEIQRLTSPDCPWKGLSSEQFTELLGEAPAYPTATNKYFELVATVPAAFNRILFYDGGIFHAAHITAPEKLCADPEKGRLTLNGFFICRRSAAG
jgi:hypothetical protein